MTTEKTYVFQIRSSKQTKDDFKNFCTNAKVSYADGLKILLTQFYTSNDTNFSDDKFKETMLNKIKIFDKQIKILQYQSSFLTKLALQNANEETDTDLSYSLIDQVTSVDQHMPALLNKIEAQVKNDFGKLPQSKNGDLKTKKTDYNYPIQKDQTQNRQDVTEFDQKHSQKKKPRDRYTITPDRFRKSSVKDYNIQDKIGKQAAKLLRNIYSLDFCKNEAELNHRQEEVVTYLRFLMKKDSTGLMPPREREMYQKVVLNHKLLDCLFDYTGRRDFDNADAILKAYGQEGAKIIEEGKYTLTNPGLG